MVCGWCWLGSHENSVRLIYIPNRLWRMVDIQADERDQMNIRKPLTLVAITSAILVAGCTAQTSESTPANDTTALTEIDYVKVARTTWVESTPTNQRNVCSLYQRDPALSETLITEGLSGSADHKEKLWTAFEDVLQVEC